MTKSRLTREDWVAVAREALITSGVDAVKVDLLAKRLLTRSEAGERGAPYRDLTPRA